MKNIKANEVSQRQYWHCSTIEYKVGDIIKTGNFYHYGSPASQLTPSEFLLEGYRVHNLPNEVSRLNCIFACETDEAFINFIKTYKLIDKLYIYKIKPTKKCNISKKNFLATNILKQANVPLTLHNNQYNSFVEAYWLSKGPAEFLEILIPVDCEVVSLYNISIILTPQ